MRVTWQDIHDEALRRIQTRQRRVEAGFGNVVHEILADAEAAARQAPGRAGIWREIARMDQLFGDFRRADRKQFVGFRPDMPSAPAVAIKQALWL